MNNQGSNNQTQITFPFRLVPAMFPPGILTPRMMVASPVVALGDMFYGKDGVNFVRLPLTNNAALTAKNGVPFWQAGYTGTITIPKITTATGSITVVNGIITAVVQPT